MKRQTMPDEMINPVVPDGVFITVKDDGIHPLAPAVESYLSEMDEIRRITRTSDTMWND